MARRRTAYTLRRDGRVRYSPAEREIFSFLREHPRDTVVIARLHYGRKNGGDVPFNGRQIVIGALRSLERKVRHNGEPFSIESSKRAGPRPMTFWLAKLPEAAAS